MTDLYYGHVHEYDTEYVAIIMMQLESLRPHEDAVDLISKKNIVAMFQGKSESGIVH